MPQSYRQITSMTIDLMDTAVPFWQVPKSSTRFWYTVTNNPSPKNPFILSWTTCDKKPNTQAPNLLVSSLVFFFFSCSGPSFCLFLSLILIFFAFDVIFLPLSWHLKIMMFSNWSLRIGFQGFIIPWVKLLFEDLYGPLSQPQELEGNFFCQMKKRNQGFYSL